MIYLVDLTSCFQKTAYRQLSKLRGLGCDVVKSSQTDKWYIMLPIMDDELRSKITKEFGALKRTGVSWSLFLQNEKEFKK